MSGSNLIRRYLPATILLVVAGYHFYQNRTVDRSAWGTGCGFGMFSTVEYHGTRKVKCLAMTADGAQELLVPEAVSLRVRALPTKKNLQELADGLLTVAVSRWPSTTSVKVELWHTNFEAESRTLSVSLSKKVRADRKNEPGGDQQQTAWLPSSRGFGGAR